MFIKINYAGQEIYLNAYQIAHFQILGDNSVIIFLVNGEKRTHQGNSHLFLQQIQSLSTKP